MLFKASWVVGNAVGVRNCAKKMIDGLEVPVAWLRIWSSNEQHVKREGLPALLHKHHWVLGSMVGAGVQKYEMGPFVALAVAASAPLCTLSRFAVCSWCWSCRTHWFHSSNLSPIQHSGLCYFQPLSFSSAWERNLQPWKPTSIDALTQSLRSALLHAVSISAPWEECGLYIRYESCTSFFEPQEVQIGNKKNQDTLFSFYY